MNVPRHPSPSLRRDLLFISSVKVDCKQSLSSFITIFCAKKGRKKIEVRAMSGEASSRELRSEGRLFTQFVHFRSRVGSEETARTLKQGKRLVT